MSIRFGFYDLFFLDQETQKVINCEHVIVPHADSIFFPVQFKVTSNLHGATSVDFFSIKFKFVV